MENRPLNGCSSSDSGSGSGSMCVLCADKQSEFTLDASRNVIDLFCVSFA